MRYGRDDWGIDWDWYTVERWITSIGITVMTIGVTVSTC